MKKLLALFVVVLGFSAVTLAQTATATASGTILSAIGITKTGTDMNFGTFVTNATGGTLVLTPAGARTVGSGGLVLAAGTITAAVFTVTGTGASTFAITLPASYTITRVSGTETMLVNTFTSTPSGTGTLVGGTSALEVGATLVVGNTTTNPAGVYTNITGFPVTVNYN